MKDNPFTFNNWIYLLHRSCSKIPLTTSTEKAIYWATHALTDGEFRDLLQILLDKLNVTLTMLAEFYKLNNGHLSDWFSGNNQSVYIKGILKEFITSSYRNNISNRFTIPLNHICQSWLFGNCTHPKCRYIHDSSAILVRANGIEAIRTKIISSGNPRVIIFVDYSTGRQTLKNLTNMEYSNDVFIIVFIPLDQYDRSFNFLKQWFDRPGFYIICSTTHNPTSTFINMAFEIGHLQASLCISPTDFWIASNDDHANDLAMLSGTDIFKMPVKILNKAQQIKMELKQLFAKS